MVDVHLQRKNMVEGQVRPSDVTDRRITAAMSDLPRERFVPPDFARLAYLDEALDFGSGNFVIAPRALAKLIQLADIDSNDTVLVVGGACGYAAAVVANLARKVTALLPSEASASLAQKELSDLRILNVEAKSGTLQDGWSASAPYNVIVVEGAIGSVPPSLLSQLSVNGRLVAVERRKGIGRALIVLRTSDVFDQRSMFELASPSLPGFEEERPAFVF